jgi:hypothetical protein
MTLQKRLEMERQAKEKAERPPKERQRKPPRKDVVIITKNSKGIDFRVLKRK